jgi:hypothetical protein
MPCATWSAELRMARNEFVLPIGVREAGADVNDGIGGRAAGVSARLPNRSDHRHPP